MTTNLDQLIAAVHAARREAHTTELEHKLHIEALIQQKIEKLRTAIKEHFGDDVANALDQAEGEIEVWMRINYLQSVPFTPERWKQQRFPSPYVVLAFTYRTCRLHLVYRSSGDWDLFTVRPVVHKPSEAWNHTNSRPADQNAIFYAAERSIPAHYRQHLLLMIEELARKEENA